MPDERDETSEMDTAAALEYLAHNGYCVRAETLRHHRRKGRIQAKVYGKKQAAVFVFAKDELDRFLSEEVPRLKVRGNPRKGGTH